jgi:hypothetical protein
MYTGNLSKSGIIHNLQWIAEVLNCRIKNGANNDPALNIRLNPPAKLVGPSYAMQVA